MTKAIPFKVMIGVIELGNWPVIENESPGLKGPLGIFETSGVFDSRYSKVQIPRHSASS
jgi:hypothetical protein